MLGEVSVTARAFYASASMQGKRHAIAVKDVRTARQYGTRCKRNEAFPYELQIPHFVRDDNWVSEWQEERTRASSQ